MNWKDIFLWFLKEDKKEHNAHFEVEASDKPDISNTEHLTPAPLWQRILFYIVVSIAIILLFIGIFIIIIRIVSIFRGYFSVEAIPWLYAIVYALTVAISVVVVLGVYNLIKDKQVFNRFFI